MRNIFIFMLLLSFNLNAKINWKSQNTMMEIQATNDKLEFVPGQYIVKLKNHNSFMPSLSNLNIAMNSKAINVKYGNYRLISFMSQLTSSSLDIIRNHPDVEYVEPNYIYYIQPYSSDETTTSIHKEVVSRNNPEIRDTLYNKQWGHPQTHVDKIWSTHKGSRDVIVAVIDTGIYYNHEDLKTNMWVNQLEKDGIKGVDDDGNGFVDDIHGWDFGYGDSDPRDGNGHGSHCAGTIGAIHNDKGIRGININVRLMALQFGYSNGGATIEKAINSINYAVNNGAQILSNSWGGFPYSEALKDSIRNARDHGVLFVAASGNNKRDIDKEKFYPASYDLDNILVVSAINEKGNRASFANWGKNTVDLFAPGKNIISTVNKTNWRPKWYRKMSGTSMATPYVAGAASLKLSENPNLDYKELIKALLDSSAPSSKIKDLSKAGLLDIESLMKH